VFWKKIIIVIWIWLFVMLMKDIKIKRNIAYWSVFSFFSKFGERSWRSDGFANNSTCWIFGLCLLELHSIT
jgi:hypothetical protein